MRSMAIRLLAAVRRQGARLAGALLLGAACTAAPAQTVTYIHTDPVGNPVLATDANGDVVWKESYKPYGEEQKNPTAAGGSHLGFSGQPFDDATGLGYFGGRHYDPVLGRFLGVDPAPPDPNDLVHSLNRYAYGNNNPYRYVDPDGRSAVLAFALPPLLLGGAWWVTRSADQREQMVRDASRALHGFTQWVFNEKDGDAKPSGKDAEGGAAGQKDVTRRPSRVRTGTEQGNWENAENGETGGKTCPTCGKEVSSKPGERNKDWDNDHNPPWRDRDLSGKDRKGVLDEYNRDTRLRCVNCNRSDNGH